MTKANTDSSKPAVNLEDKIVGEMIRYEGLKVILPTGTPTISFVTILNK